LNRRVPNGTHGGVRGRGYAAPPTRLGKENHQPGWWFQKALALPRKNIRAKRGTTNKDVRSDINQI